jgi:predicted Rossmann-fold nucleotide-binding protein
MVESMPDRVGVNDTYNVCMKRICVFCGSSAGSRPEYRAAAEEMGARLWREKMKIGSWVSFA